MFLLLSFYVFDTLLRSSQIVILSIFHPVSGGKGENKNDYRGYG